MRKDGRKDLELRGIKIIPDYVKNVPGSVLFEQGETKLICTATYDNRVPHFIKDTGKGWITAEYSMIPGSVGNQRLNRERYKINNRNIEIQRFISRALRNIFNLRMIVEKTIYIDIDVIQADGSTRCAAINCSMLVLLKTLRHLVYENLIKDFPEVEIISAVSIGVKDKKILVDLTYEEDSSVNADINIVSSEKKNIIEVQAFAEESPIQKEIFQKAVDIGVEKNIEIINLLKEHID